jgi:hypothetical protein
MSPILRLTDIKGSWKFPPPEVTLGNYAIVFNGDQGDGTWEGDFNNNGETLVVVIRWNDLFATISSAIYGGQTMTSGILSEILGYKAQIFYLLNAPQGINTLVVNYSAPMGNYSAVISAFSCINGVSIGNTGSHNFSSEKQLTVTITSTSKSLIIGGAEKQRSVEEFNTTSGTEIEDVQISTKSARAWASVDTGTGGNITLTTEWTTNGGAAMAVLEILP